jgi:hypothetical protein
VAENSMAAKPVNLKISFKMEKTPKITDFEEFLQVFSNSLCQLFAIFNNFFQ